MRPEAVQDRLAKRGAIAGRSRAQAGLRAANRASPQPRRSREEHTADRQTRAARAVAPTEEAANAGFCQVTAVAEVVRGVAPSGGFGDAVAADGG